MELYSVLLVDDEEDIRIGISRKIDWNKLGFSLVGEAENGREALDLADQLKPDLILTDIKMPFMDGLELCRILTNRLPAAKFVIFSGFDDFEYAKQAVSLNISEYILKPINAPELSEILRRLKKQLDAERTQRQDSEALRRSYQESLPILRELFYARLLDGRIHPDQIAERAALYSVELGGSALAVAFAQFDSNGSQSELLTLSVRKLFDENMNIDGAFSAKTFIYNDCVAIFVRFKDEVQIYAFADAVNRVCKLAKSYLGISLTVGIGTPCASPADLGISTAGARSALDYRILVGAGRAIYINDLEPNTNGLLTFDENDSRELSSAVKVGTDEDVRVVVSRLMNKIHEAGLAISKCQLFFLELLTCLLKLTRDTGTEPSAVFGRDFTGSIQITDFGSINELGRWCEERCLLIRELIRRQRTDSAWRIVERAKAFIAENFSDCDLSVEMLCDHLHLSPAYFSTLFKRETGMSFTSYVTVERMECAASLLRGTEEKTYLIAERTGYPDPNYFSYVFKKHFGVSPTRYRAG